MSNSGLVNFGCTCYFNTAIQCMFNVKLFRDFVLKQEELPTSATLMLELQSLFQDMDMSSTFSSSVSPHNMLNTIKISMGSLMEIDEQNDIQEFTVMFLDKLNACISHQLHRSELLHHIDLSNNLAAPAYTRFLAGLAANWFISHKKEYSNLIDVFYGQQTNQIQCGQCNHISHVCETFVCLPLSFNESPTIESMLADYMKHEILDGRTCDACKTQCDGTKMHKISRMPQTLMICIQRFKHSGTVTRKIHTKVDVPEHLDLNDFAIHNMMRSKYTLASIACHFGSANNGHYVAVCKHNDMWFAYDDTNCHKLKGYDEIDASTYYMMVYERD